MRTVLISVIVIAFYWQAECFDWLPQPIDGPEKLSEKVYLIFTWVVKFYSDFLEHWLGWIGCRPDTRNAVYLPLKDLPFLMTHPAFDVTRPTVMYFHGWMSDGQLKDGALVIRGAYNDRGDHNVITVDWSAYANSIYYHIAVIPQLKVVSKQTTWKVIDPQVNDYNEK